MSTNWTDELSQQMEHHEVEAPAGLWEGIEQGLKAQKRVRRAKLVWPWRIGAAAAVVAGVVAGVQLWEADNGDVTAGGPKRTMAEAVRTQMDNLAESRQPVLKRVQHAAAKPQLMAEVAPSNAESTPSSSVSAEPSSNSNPSSSNSNPSPSETEGHVAIEHQPSPSATGAQSWPQSGRWKGGGVTERRGRGRRGAYSMNLQLMANANYVGTVSYGDAVLGSAMDEGYRSQGDSIALQSQRREKMPMPSRAQRVIDTSPRYSDHEFPVKVGATVRVPLSRWLSMDAGLSYACLRSDLDFTTSDGVRKVGTVQRVHYLGVPVTLVGNLWENRRWNVYASAGGEVAKSVKTQWRDQDGRAYEGCARPWQWSVSAAVGMQLNLNRHFGLYVQPSLDYYFDNRSSVQTYYNEHPFTPALRMGVRVKL